MHIVALNESDQENRVSITPQHVPLYLKSNFKIGGEQGLGKKSGFKDEAYLEAGAYIEKDRKTLLQHSQVVICINEPHVQDLRGLNSESLLIAPVHNHPQSELLQWCIKHRLSLFSTLYIPRIARTQAMDTLTSQANLIGYRAVIEALNYFNRIVPLMITAAGVIEPAKVLILGAGIAGLQACVTAKRLGALVQVFDLKPQAKLAVESLGAEFIEYAQELNEHASPIEFIEKYILEADIIICTTWEGEQKPPLLLKQKTLERMRSGSVIVDLNAVWGGVCELTEPDKVIRFKDIIIIGKNNLAGMVAKTASELYANNMLHLIKLLSPSPGILHFDESDEMIRQCLLCHDGQPLPFQYSVGYR